MSQRDTGTTVTVIIYVFRYIFAQFFVFSAIILNNKSLVLITNEISFQKPFIYNKLKTKIMKKIIYSIIFLLILNITSAEDFFENEKAVIELSISSEITIIPASSHSSVKNLKATLSFYPTNDDIQQVKTLATEPEAETINNFLVFQWKEPEEKTLHFSLNAEIETKNTLQKTYTKIHFPIINIPDKIRDYTLPAENIDSGKETIIKKASEIAAGGSDLYIVVYELAAWTRNNIEYSLDTSTEDVSQKASWVLKNKKGVCDEITSLFIAFCRSLNIPAKYVSGVAYTNYNDLNDFGSHAWAEVYIGNKWVPFDITYNQLGFIDTSHIKLKESYDSASPSTKYEWSGINTDIKTKELDINAKARQKTGKTEKLISLSSKALKQNTGFNSYNLIETEITNPNGFYVISSLSISQTEGIETGEKHKDILLRPFETKNVFWVVKTKEFDRNYIYTFPILIYSSRNETSLTEFSASSDEPAYRLDEITAVIDEKKEETEKSYSKNVNLNCVSEKSAYYLYEYPVINCSIKNTGNVLLENLDVCLGNDCSAFDLGITQEKEFSFDIQPLKKGKMDIKITAKNSQISKTVYVNMNILDKPSVLISELEFPSNVSYEDEYEISFTLIKNSASIPKELFVKFSPNLLLKMWEINELNSRQGYAINLRGKDLSVGKNDFKIIVDFKDDNKREYKTEKSFEINLNKVNPMQRIKIFFNDIGKWFLMTLKNP